MSAAVSAVDRPREVTLDIAEAAVGEALAAGRKVIVVDVAARLLEHLQVARTQRDLAEGQMVQVVRERDAARDSAFLAAARATRLRRRLEAIGAPA